MSARSFLGHINPLVATLMLLASSTAAVRLYYHLKPAIPRPLRYALRHKLARRQRSLCVDVWPILQAAAVPPVGWTGWPQQRRFALILTHDVESAKGLTRVKELAEL